MLGNKRGKSGKAKEKEREREEKRSTRWDKKRIECGDGGAVVVELAVVDFGIQVE